MLNELVEFGKTIRNKSGSIENDALKQEFIDIDLVIDELGNFKFFTAHDKIATKAETILAKKGKARLLLDKAEEVLGFEAKKHGLYMAKLQEYRDVPSLKPVLLFYEDNKENGLELAKLNFHEALSTKEQIGQIAFLVLNQSQRVHENSDVIAAIIEHFEESQKTKLSLDKLCSICGEAKHPIINQPHGMIKRVPDGQMAGSALISYNENAYESYGLISNENSSICTACARNYVEGLNYLLGNGVLIKEEKSTGKGKPKEYYKYSNRKNLASDTAMIYWTKNHQAVEEVEYLYNPQEFKLDIEALLKQEQPKIGTTNASEFGLLANSPASGNQNALKSVEVDRFYSCILSGAAARIAIRNWIESSSQELKLNIANWFNNIAIEELNFDTKPPTPVRTFFSIRELYNCCGVHRKEQTGESTRYTLDKKDDFIGRAGNMLWGCALTGKLPPQTLLDRILRRIKMEEGTVTGARVALLKLILNRTSKTGALLMKEKLDKENSSVAYSAGRIFAVLESIQSAALGKELNAPIRDRFFSSASTNPSSAFGRLFKMSNNHLAKLRGERPGLAVNLDKLLGEICVNISEFPTIFSLEQQGQFAIGYYHQRQEQFSKKANKDTNLDLDSDAD